MLDFFLWKCFWASSECRVYWDDWSLLRLQQNKKIKKVHSYQDNFLQAHKQQTWMSSGWVAFGAVSPRRCLPLLPPTAAAVTRQWPFSLQSVRVSPTFACNREHFVCEIVVLSFISKNKWLNLERSSCGRGNDSSGEKRWWWFRKIWCPSSCSLRTPLLPPPAIRRRYVSKGL